VERVFPLHSPRVDKVEVERHGAVRRAKLTYLRHRIGKGATLVPERASLKAEPAAKAEPALKTEAPAKTESADKAEVK
jgi:hypothetical protein